MRLFEAIRAAHERLGPGDKPAALPVAEYAGALPVAALTCIDPRLNHLLPDALGIPEKEFIWLRNAGNIITGPLSSTMRSLALACAVKGAKEIALIGHTDCLVSKTSAMQLLDRLATLGVDRHRLPENLVQYFGLFASERQNVLRGVDVIRSSPLIGPRIPVHGLLLDLKTGRLEWIANGYEAFATVASGGKAGELIKKADDALDAFATIGNIAAEELKLPTAKIGEVVSIAHDWLHTADSVVSKVEHAFATPGVPPSTGAAGSPAKSATPPPLGGVAAAWAKLRPPAPGANSPKSGRKP